MRHDLCGEKTGKNEIMSSATNFKVILCPDVVAKLSGRDPALRGVSMDFLSDPESPVKMLLLGKRPARRTTQLSDTASTVFTAMNVCRFEPPDGSTDGESCSVALAEIDSHLAGGVNVIGYAFVGEENYEDNLLLEKGIVDDGWGELNQILDEQVEF